MAVFLSLIFLIAIPSVTACDRCVHKSQAAFFRDESALQNGACGYGPLAPGFNAGHIASVVTSMYKDGAICGACFQIRCNNTEICTKEGTNVTVFDRNVNDQLDFVLSASAFKAMAQKGKEQEVLNLGIVDVEYKRVPCNYSQNLAIRAEELSGYPSHLAIKFLFQGGQTDILSVYVAQVDSSNWNVMNRNYGAIWDASGVPDGPLQLRIGVADDASFYYATNALPADWKIGAIYDSGLQIHTIAHEDCSPCDDDGWY